MDFSRTAFPRCGRLTALKQRFSLRGSYLLSKFQGRHNDRLARPYSLELLTYLAGELLECIRSIKNDINNTRRDLQFRAAGSIEQGLEVVRQISERVQMEHPSASLEGVKGAEDRVNRRCVTGILLQEQKTLLDGLKQFERFAVEFPQQFAVLIDIQMDRRLIRNPRRH